MRRLITGIIAAALLMFSLPAVGEARWWIFGVAKEEINIDYLFLNQSSYDDLGPRVTVFRETLPDGHVEIRGKASVRQGVIAAVRISLDGRKTWRDAQLSDGGAFLFRFRPEMGRTYQMFVEIMDTRGRTNNVDATRKELVLSEQNIRAALREALEGMAEAYRNRDAARFMTYVAQHFRGDASNLERAVRKDFSHFSNIDLRLTEAGIAADAKGVMHVSVNFTRFLVSTRTGRSINDRGVTEFTFVQGERGPQLLAMRNPLLFGMTDAANVATGTTRQISPQPMIIVDDRGNVARVPADVYNRLVGRDGLVITVNPDGSASVRTDDLTVRVNQAGLLENLCVNPSEVGKGRLQFGGTTLVGGTPIFGGTPHGEGFSFSAGQVQLGTGDFTVLTGDNTSLHVLLGNGVSFSDLGAVSIGSITEAPATGYSPSHPSAQLFQGRTYAFRLANGRFFGLIEIRSITTSAHGGVATFYFEFQPDGSRCF